MHGCYENENKGGKMLDILKKIATLEFTALKNGERILST